MSKNVFFLYQNVEKSSMSTEAKLWADTNHALNMANICFNIEYSNWEPRNGVDNRQNQALTNDNI